MAYAGVHESGCWKDILRQLKRLAPLDELVIFSGESGTGKELLARIFHEMSGRDPFVPVQCPNLKPEIFCSEVFGTTRGGFTGAQDKIGLIERADGGTILFSDFNELKLESQADLLGLFDDMKYRHVGGLVDRLATARIVATTNRDLAQMLDAGHFRADLFWRLEEAATIHIPPVRERPEDILPLIEHFLRVSKLNPDCRIKLGGLDSDCIKELKQQTWPGNVRSISSAVHRALLRLPEGAETLFAEQVLAVASSVKSEDSRKDCKIPVPRSYAEFSSQNNAMEIAMILQVIKEHNGNKSRAAAQLGISYTQIFKRIRILDIVDQVDTQTKNVLVKKAASGQI